MTASPAWGKLDHVPGDDVIRVDAQGGTILPGFIDTHVHMMMQFSSIPEMIAAPFSLKFFQSTQYMKATLDAEVTTVRDAGGADLGVKQAIEKGIVVGPRMQISVSILGITGGHVDWWNPSGTTVHLFHPYPGYPDGICDGVEEVRKKVREVLRAGAEVIKVCATGGVISPHRPPRIHAVYRRRTARDGAGGRISTRY